MSSEVNHSFEWSSVFIWVGTALAGIAVTMFNLFIRSRDEKMAEMIKNAVTEIISKADERYVTNAMCGAAHKLTDQNLMTIRDDIHSVKTQQLAQYTELRDMINLILDKVIR